MPGCTVASLTELEPCDEPCGGPIREASDTVLLFDSFQSINISHYREPVVAASLLFLN